MLFTFTVTSDVNEDASMGTNKQQVGFDVKIEPEVLICSNNTKETESKIFCVKIILFFTWLQKHIWYMYSFHKLFCPTPVC